MVFPAKRVLNWGASRGARAGRRALLAAGWLAASAFSAPSATRRQLPEAAAPPTPAPTPTEQLTPNSRRAYDEVLKLRLAPARALLQAELARTPTAPAPLLVADCADFIELMVSQDEGRYAAVAAAQQARLAALERAPAGALRDYARAEIMLHLGLGQVLFKHLVAGGWNLRRGYQQMEAVTARYPSFYPARKTLGVCQFAVGSLPEGYHWLLRLLGLRGDVAAGLRNLALAAARPHDFQTESQIFQALIREGYYKRPDEALRLAERLRAEQPDNLLFSYLLLSINKRQHRADAALAAYRACPSGPGYLPVAYLRHMAADLLLYQGDYAGSERENLAFLREYQGRHYRKDAAFKLYLAAWLGGAPAAAVARYREQINQPGPTDVEEDTYAQHYYHEARALHPVLTRARLQADGGYYRAALATLATFRAGPAASWRDRIEEPYRRARAYEGLGRTDSAWAAYQRTVDEAAGRAPFYFAPQAALQMGYLARQAGHADLARQCFERALRYPWHEYKNSTDAKAALALRELPAR